MANSSVNVSSGIGLPGMLFIVFLVLKLCEVITWSWWWVTAPLWIPLAVVAAIFITVFAVALIVAVLK